MSSGSNSNASGGIGVVGMLGVLFVALKLTGVIDWSWWWVTLPFWAWVPIALVVLIGGGLFVLILTILGRKK